MGKNKLLFLVGLSFDIRWIGIDIFSEVTWRNLQLWIIGSVILSGVSLIVISCLNKVFKIISSKRNLELINSKFEKDSVYNYFYSGLVAHYAIYLFLFGDAESLFIMWLHICLWINHFFLKLK